MSNNANYIPLGTNRKVFGGDPSASLPPLQQTNFVDAMGKPIERQIVSGACTKCGYAGHLPFQCRNNLPIEIDGIFRNPIRSPSSDFETPLQKEDRKQREREAKRIRKQLIKQEKKAKKDAKKRKRRYSSDSDSKKKSKKHKKKSSKKRRRRSSSTSSSSSSD